MNTEINGMKRIRELLSGIVEVPAEEDAELTGLAIDSRCVCPGYLFIALAGTVYDGRDYIDQAIANGAVAILYENSQSRLSKNHETVPYYPISNLRDLVGVIADRFYGHPSKKMKVVGVTGTNGKTTCTQLLAQVLDASQTRCAVIGTLGNGFTGELDTTIHTTPDAITLHSLLAKYFQQGANYVCIEVSSHALEQGRVSGVVFDIAIFTNLSREHLDYHGDMQAYAEAKTKLFDMPELTVAVINKDDEYGRALIRRLRGRIKTLSYGHSEADVVIKSASAIHDGMQLSFDTPAGDLRFTSQLYGGFNASNIAAVITVLIELGFGHDEISRRLGKIKPIAGRAEKFGGQASMPLVFVDYAHTPDALEKILLALREHTQGKIWCVFGCGGDRDRGKRPEMGRIAERLADHVVLTNDNPRSEQPQSIVNNILAGMKTRPEIEHDRKRAIMLAITAAADGDIVLIAGKGHEEYQQIGEKKIPFSDREAIRNILGEAA